MAPAARQETAPILVVDDDAKIVSLVRTYLEREGYSVITAGDGMAALRAIHQAQPKLVVLDLMLPQLDGLAVLQAAREESDVPILMLSARGSTADRVYGIKTGADDYLAKPFSPAELVARVNAILRRMPGPPLTRASTGRPLLQRADLVIDRDRHEVRQAGHPIALTAAEFRILSALVEADGRVLSREFLLNALYGESQGEALDRTIDVHIGRLREKLADNADRPRYIATVRGAGYRAVSQQER